MTKDQFIHLAARKYAACGYCLYGNKPATIKECKECFLDSLIFVRRNFELNENKYNELFYKGPAS